MLGGFYTWRQKKRKEKKKSTCHFLLTSRHTQRSQRLVHNNWCRILGTWERVFEFLEEAKLSPARLGQQIRTGEYLLPASWPPAGGRHTCSTCRCRNSHLQWQLCYHYRVWGQDATGHPTERHAGNLRWNSWNSQQILQVLFAPSKKAFYACMGLQPTWNKWLSGWPIYPF